MNERNFLVTMVACLSLILSAGCTPGGDKTGADRSAPQKVTGVSLAAAAEEATPEIAELTGTVRARTSAVIAARIPGTVSVLKVREGDRVKKGQLLVQLEAAEQAAGASGAQAGADEARRGLEEAQTRKKLADVTFSRYEKLFKEQAVTRQEFDTRQTERDLAVQGVARAEARLKQAEEGSRAAGAVADYRRVVAPIGGVVTARQVDPGATVFPGQPLMTVEDEGSYQLELAVPESLAAAVKPGLPVQVTLDAGSAPFGAQITETVPAADPASRTFIAKVKLPQKGLKSGTFGRGSITLGSTTRGLFVPRSALFERGALTAVWVVDKENIARMRLVKPGRKLGDRMEVLSGLSVGERVVTIGVERVTDGARIQ